eukprot:4922702-Prymnesium_polylepis.1
MARSHPCGRSASQQHGQLGRRWEAAAAARRGATRGRRSIHQRRGTSTQGGDAPLCCAEHVAAVRAHF